MLKKLAVGLVIACQLAMGPCGVALQRAGITTALANQQSGIGLGGMDGIN